MQVKCLISLKASYLSRCLKKKKGSNFHCYIQFPNECLTMVFPKELDVVIATI